MIKYSKQAVKFLKKQPANQRKRIIKAIKNLPDGNVKILKGIPFKRLRVGDYRVFFNDVQNYICRKKQVVVEMFINKVPHLESKKKRELQHKTRS